MELKNAHVAVDTTTEMVVIEGKCPSCYRGVRRPLDSFKQLGYVCECGTTVTPPEGLEVLLDAAIKKGEVASANKIGRRIRDRSAARWSLHAPSSVAHPGYRIVQLQA